MRLETNGALPRGSAARYLGVNEQDLLKICSICIGIILFVSPNAYSGYPMGGLGDAMMFLLFLLIIQVAVLLTWLIAHIWPEKVKHQALIIRTLIDAVVIVYCSILLGLFSGLPFGHFKFVKSLFLPQKSQKTQK